MLISLCPKGSPDMIQIAFDVKFHDYNEGIPPRACRPPRGETTGRGEMRGSEGMVGGRRRG